MKCSRCGHRTWLETHDRTHFARCICGLFSPLDVVVGDARIRHRETLNDISLPRTGSKMSDCLGMLASLAVAHTEDIASKMGQSSSETATQLGVLEKRGLVIKTANGKGVKGGSKWALADVAERLLGLHRGVQNGTGIRDSQG